MRLSGLRLATLVLLSAASASCSFAQTASLGSPAALQADRITVASNFNVRAAVSGHLARWQAAASDRGALPDAQTVQLNFGIARAPEVQAAFDQLLLDLQNPSSPRYHQWLTPAQVGEQYGPTQHDLDSFTAWLTGQGFKVDGIAPSRIFVQASAPSAVVSATFQTSIHSYMLNVGGRDEILQAPTSEPTMPAALAAIVNYVGGLTDVPLHTYSHIATASAPALPVAAAAQTSGLPARFRPDLNVSGGTHYITPLDFNKIYDVTASGLTGTGQRIMIVGGSRIDPADISNWESLTAQAAYTPNYIVGLAFTDPGLTADSSQGEITLDFERAFGTAPNAGIDLIIAKNALSGSVNANLIQYAIGTVNDPVMSLSFGACENLQTPSYVRQEDSVYAVAESQGISVLVSSGDAGVAGCEAHGVAPPANQIASINDICATSHVTCVGGTQFNDTANPAAYWSSTNSTGLLSALGYIPEGAWNEPINNGSNAASVPYIVAATGGGPSVIISKPVWQSGTGVPADGARDVPDISFSGAGHDGYFSCLGYAGGSCVSSNGSTPFIVFSGTSASAPSMAGVAALIDQKLAGRQGNLNPALYRLAASAPAAFHDTTIASSGVGTCSTATPSVCNNSDAAPNSLTGGIAGYALQTGYDLATGLGSLDVSAYLTAVSQVSTGSIVLTPASATLSTPAGTTVTDVITLTSNNFTGTQNLTCTVFYNGSGTASNTPGCVIAPASVIFTGSGSATATLTITSLKSSALMGGAVAASSGLSLKALGGAALCGLLLFCLPGKGRRTLRNLRVLAAILLFGSALGMISGCGSGGSGSTTPTPTGPRTTAGSYTVTVISNSSASQTNVGSSTTVNLTIQ